MKNRRLKQIMSGLFVFVAASLTSSCAANKSANAINTASIHERPGIQSIEFLLDGRGTAGIEGDIRQNMRGEPTAYFRSIDNRVSYIMTLKTNGDINAEIIPFYADDKDAYSNDAFKKSLSQQNGDQFRNGENIHSINPGARVFAVTSTFDKNDAWKNSTAVVLDIANKAQKVAELNIAPPALTKENGNISRFLQSFRSKLELLASKISNASQAVVTKKSTRPSSPKKRKIEHGNSQ